MKRTSKLLILSVILLMILSLFMIYSASYIWAEYKFDNPFKYVINQGIFVLLGIILLFIVSKINYKIYYDKANLILLICLIFLLILFQQTYQRIPFHLDNYLEHILQHILAYLP